MFRSLRWRLVGWYVLLLTGVLLLFSIGIYLAVQKLLLDSVDDALTHQAALIANTIVITDDGPHLKGDVELRGRRDSEFFTRLYRSDGTQSFEQNSMSERAPDQPDAVADALRGKRRITQAQTREGTMRIATFPIAEDKRIVGAIQVGMSLEDSEDTLRRLIKVLLVLAPTILLLASGGGLFLAYRALAPIDRITRTAQRISAENLGGRIAFTGPNDEVGRLARTFDAMLARLEAAFIRQRQFTADASHEIRTPLTAIIGQIDVALERPRDTASYQATLTTVREQAQRLARLASDLLFLARADAQALRVVTEPIALDSLLPAIVAQVEPLAAARSQTVTLTPAPAVTYGDEDQLIRMLLNLLDNAIRYTPPGGRIAVDCTPANGSIAIRVADSGPGIAQEHLPRLFDRFYRIDRGRNRAQGGSGLGLAIAQCIAQAHGGQITIESAIGQGSAFTVVLPGAGVSMQ